MEVVLLIGRIVFGGMFLAWGATHFFKLNAMAGYVQSSGVPAPKLSVALTGIMLVIGSLSILLGLYAWVGAVILIAFLVPTTLIMHKFWGIKDQMTAAMQMTMFMKNTALIGALLLIIYFGSGPYSIT